MALYALFLTPNHNYHRVATLFTFSKFNQRERKRLVSLTNLASGRQGPL